MSLAIKFWKEYEEAHSLERTRIIEKTMFFERTRTLLESSFSDDDKRTMFYQVLVSYFDDLLEYKDDKDL